MAHVVLGVSAGVAVYKSADLASRLTQRGDRVRTLMTPHSLEFMTPLTFRAVTGELVFTDEFRTDVPGAMEHISLSAWGEVLLVAPATADVIGKLAAGLADNVLTSTVLAFPGPVAVAPAMNDRMWSHPLVRANVERLASVAGYRIVEPESGHLACGTEGPGRLASTERLIAVLDELLSGDRAPARDEG